MLVTREVIKDIYYKMYFFLPRVSEEMPSCDAVFEQFWKKYGITNLNAHIKYSNSEEEKFSESYFGTATAVDVTINFSNSNIQIPGSEEVLDRDFKEAIRGAYVRMGQDRKQINEYWKKHSKELLFLITRRNNVENQSIKNEVQKNLSEFNDNALRFINELIQNADDCIFNANFNTFTMLFDIESNEIIISYPEEGFTYADIISLSSINETNKMTDFDKATNTIGEKGRGFKSIFVYFKEVEIESGGYHFKYNIDEASMFQPIYLGEPKSETGTKLVLRLKDEIVLSGGDEEEKRNIASDIRKLIMDVKEFYGASSPQNLYRNNSIFFTRNFTELRMIFRNHDTSDIIRIRNEHGIEADSKNSKIWWNNPDNKFIHSCTGAMEYTAAYQVENSLIEKGLIEGLSPSYKLNLVGLVKYIQFTPEIVEQRYGKVTTKQIDEIKNNMPIVIFGIRDIDIYDEYYAAYSDVSTYSGHMYTYLPTSLNIRLPFIFQIPFDLEDNRSCPKSKSRWNGYLLDFIWNKKESIIREWYEYVEREGLVQSTYSYLPTKKSTSGTCENLAFYIDEKYNFDPLGGSKYAAYAKDQIVKFNKGNANRAKQLFESIEIFENLDNANLVNIDHIRILDETIAAFDINGENIYWKYYKQKQDKLVRFIFNAGHDIARQVVEFQKFLNPNKRSAILSWDSVADDKDIHAEIETEIRSYGESKQFEKMKAFSERFLDAEIWLQKYGISEIEELNGDKINNIRQWGSGLLYFKVSFFGGATRWVRYDVTGKVSCNLWLTSEDAFESVHYKKSNEKNLKNIRVSIICTKQIEKCNIIKLFVNNTVDSYSDILFQIENWQEREVTVEDKLWIAGCYYLNCFDYDTVPNKHISQLFNGTADINAVAELPSLFEIQESHRVEWERSRFLSWNAGKKQQNYELNIRFLSEDIIRVINPIDGSMVSARDKKIRFLSPVNGRNLSNAERTICLDKFNSAYPNIIINPDYFRYIETRNFLKFPAQGILLLRDIENLSEACESESILPTEFIQGVRKRYELIKRNELVPKGMGRNSGIIKAIQAYQIFSLIDNTDYREIVGKEGIVYSELLQNVNDYASPETCLAISIEEDTDGRYWMTMVYKEKEHIEKNEIGEEPKHGFLPSDILALISIGDSSKKKENHKYTGNKGIGFKNIYKMFDQVTIDSNGYRFLLDDSYAVNPERLYECLIERRIIDPSFDKKGVVESVLLQLRTESMDDFEENGERKKFPIIQLTNDVVDKSIFYRAQSDLIGGKIVDDDSLTAFRFRLRNDSGILSSLQSQLSGSYSIWMLERNKDQLKQFRFNKSIGNSYNMAVLFLHNLGRVYVEDGGMVIKDEYIPVTGEGGHVIDSWIESDNFWSNRDYLSGLNLIPSKSARYERKKNFDEDGIFANVEVRFMKNPFLIADSGKRTVPNEGCLYVTLPTNIGTGGAVHINIPAFETKADRQDIVPLKTSDVTTEGQWNINIANKVFGTNGVFVRLFNCFTERYMEIVANYAFLYVPINLYVKFNKDYMSFNSGLGELKFIPCITASGMRMRSLQEIQEGNNIYKLKPYMYQWFDLMDPAFEKFYCTENNDVEFIYMKDQNGWDLINEFKKYKRLQPQARDYNPGDFFGYVAHYWKVYYDFCNEQQKRECDKNFANRINILTSKTEIENHYSKWCVWKKFYIDSMAGMSKDTFIDNMIMAVCFDCNDFRKAFYFTASNIKDILGNKDLEVPDGIVTRYKKHLISKGYFDFMRYFELLKTELGTCGEQIVDKYELKLINQYAISVYTGSSNNELVPVSVSSQDILSRIYYKHGIKSLEKLLNEIPVLLMNNEFVEDEQQDFFVKLPSSLFKKNSIQLNDSEDCCSVLEMWRDAGYVVSRANISSANNIYNLDNIDREFEVLLPALSDSRIYLDLIWKKKLLSESMVNNILEFWKNKISDGIQKVDYFELYIIKYASSIAVNIQKKSTKKKRNQEAPLFSVNNGRYMFDNHELILRGADIQNNKVLVINMLDSLIKILDDVENNIVINIEMTTDRGLKKAERFNLNLTHCHRALMVYELSSAKNELMKAGGIDGQNT